MSTSALSALDQLMHFLRHAPALFPAAAHPLLLRLHLPLPHHNEPIACVEYQGRHLISGTDILRILLFRFRCLARPISSMKKFEEGVFSDLRNLKPGDGARLEPARSELLDALYRFGCVRTQKRQKVFYWEAVDHDRLFRDAWEREARREREALDQFQKMKPGATLADPDAPLAMLDDATVETAAVWHLTRPLLLTIVRSSEDPIERPLNAGAVTVGMGADPDSATSAMLGLQRFRSSSNGSGKEEDRCGGLIVRRRAAVARSRASSGNSDKDSVVGLLPPPPTSMVQGTESDWWVAAGLTDPALWNATALPPLQHAIQATDSFMNLTSLDLPALAGSTTTTALPSLPEWMMHQQPQPMTAEAMPAVDPVAMYPELFVDAFNAAPAYNVSAPAPVPSLLNTTLKVRTSPEPPVRRGVVDRASLMAELEAFLTPPANDMHDTASSGSYHTVPEDTSVSFGMLEQRPRRPSQTSPTVRVEDDKVEAFPEVPSSRTHSPVRSNTPWPIPKMTQLTHAAEHVLSQVITPPSATPDPTALLGKRLRRPSSPAPSIDFAATMEKRPRVSYF